MTAIIIAVAVILLVAGTGDLNGFSATEAVGVAITASLALSALGGVGGDDEGGG